MKKFLIGSVIVLSLLAVGSTAQAQTVSELQALIAQLQAQIAGLSGGASAGASAAFNSDLQVGSTGTDVVNLQNWLISKGFLQAGLNTGYFGGLTKSAVMAYQASVGLPSTGYVGPLTRERLNAATPAVPNPGTGTPATPAVPASGNGDEGQLTDIDSISADVESDIEEDEEDVNVIGAEVEAEDSDMTITRVDVDFTLTDAANGSDDLEDYITEVSLVVDGKKVATLDVDEADVDDGSASDDLTDDDNDVFSFRFSNLNAKVMEGETAEIYVAVSAVGNIDSDDAGDLWAVVIPEGGIRATDEAGISDTYVESGDIDEENFNVDVVTPGDLSVDFDTTDNEDKTVKVDEDNTTSDIEVLAFTLESDESDNTINEIEIDFATTTGQVALSSVISSVELFADGKSVGSERVTDGASNVGGTVSFDDLGIDISEDDSVEFVVKVDLRKTTGNYDAGYSFYAVLDRSAIDAEDAQGDDVSVAGSDDQGGDITLRTQGVNVTVSGTPSSSIVSNDADDPADDQGKFIIEFTVQAFEEEAFVELGAVTQGTTESNTGANFLVEDSANAATTSPAVTGSILSRVSGGTQSGNFIRINDGSSAKFRLTVYVDPAFVESYRAQLYSVNFASTATDADTQEIVAPAENFESPYELIQN